MKISKIRALVKEAAHCLILTNREGQQWIGVSDAIYPADGLTLTAEAIPALFDFSDTEKEKIRIIEQQLEGSNYDLMMDMPSAEMTEALIQVCAADRFRCMFGDGRVYMLREDRIRCAAGKEEYRRYWLSWNQQHQPVIVLENGMALPSAMLIPVRRQMVEKIQAQLRNIAFPPANGWLEPEEMDGSDGRSPRLPEGEDQITFDLNQQPANGGEEE